MKLVLLYFDESVPHAPAVYHTVPLMVSDKSEINDQEQSMGKDSNSLPWL